jgi:hypothetical protein
MTRRLEWYDRVGIIGGWIVILYLIVMFTIGIILRVMYG